MEVRQHLESCRIGKHCKHAQPMWKGFDMRLAASQPAMQCFHLSSCSAAGPFSRLPCTAFSWCSQQTCFEPDAHTHSFGDCWLKFTEGPLNPEVSSPHLSCCCPLHQSYFATWRMLHGFRSTCEVSYQMITEYDIQLHPNWCNGIQVTTFILVLALSSNTLSCQHLVLSLWHNQTAPGPQSTIMPHVAGLDIKSLCSHLGNLVFQPAQLPAGVVLPFGLRPSNGTFSPRFYW